MCGIMGYVGERSCADIVFNGLQRLEYRGYDSAGVAVLNEKKQIEIAKAEGAMPDANLCAEEAESLHQEP